MSAKLRLTAWFTLMVLILAAMVLIHSVYIGAYLSYLLIVALFTGTATGIAAAGILRTFKAVNIFQEKCADINNMEEPKT